jgi:hypothetical protein
MHEVLRLTPLPEAAVGLAPAFDRSFDEVDEEAPVIVIGRMATLVPAPALLHQLAVGVELKLADGRVADPHRADSAVAGEMVERDLVQSALATHPVERLHVLGVAGRAAFDEAPELVGLGLEPESGQRASGEA